MKKELVNINTIAKEAGVSTTTVSNFINCTETFPISEAKQEKILEVMRRFKYRPNSASCMMRRKKQMPGRAIFIYGNYPESPVFPVIQNPMLDQMLSELAVSLMKNLGVSLELRQIADISSRDAWNEALVDVEFVINYGLMHGYLCRLCRRKNIPLLAIAETMELAYHDYDESFKPDFVHWDSSKHSAIMLDHLRSKGVRKTLYVSSWNVSKNRDRFYALEAEAKIKGYKKFNEDHAEMSGCVLTPPMPENTDIYYEIRNACASLLENRELLKGVEAVLAHNDIVAQGVVAALRELGLKPGKDILVSGEGDYSAFRYQIPSITTISYDKKFLSETVSSVFGKRRENPNMAPLDIYVPSLILEKESA